MRFYMLGFLALALCSCSEVETSITQTVVSDSAVDQRMGLLERRFSKQQLCEDYRLFDLLLRDIHFEAQDGAGQNQACPASFRDYAFRLKDRIESTRDLHSTVSIGFGLDASSYPIVHSCVPEQACSHIIGSQFMSLPSASPQKFHAMATDTDQKGHIFEISSIGGESIQTLIPKFKVELGLPNGDETWPYYFSDFLLKRSALDRRSKEDFTALVMNIQSKQFVKMVLSYDDRQTIVPSPTVSFMNRQVEFARSYKCAESPDSADATVGACLNPSKKGILWVSEWPQLDDSFEERMRTQLSWLNQHVPQDLPLILDLAGNQGGSPLAVANFLCMIGDDVVQDAMQQYQMASRTWPEFFDLGTRTRATSGLLIAINTDLMFIEDGWTAKPMDVPSTRQKITGFLQRSGISPEACRGLRLPNFDRRQWLVMTNGQEFSASEDFLQIAAQAQGKFTSIGYRSAGGVGAPTWVVLPHTQSRVRISPSRTLYQQKLVVEKTGLQPTSSFTRAESEMVFLQKALHALATDAAFNPSLDPTRPALKTILGMANEDFRSLALLGTWTSDCLNGNQLEFRLSLERLVAVRRTFLDAQCSQEQSFKEREYTNPRSLLKNLDRQGVQVSKSILSDLELPPLTRLSLRRSSDDARLQVCIEAGNCL